MTHREIPGFYFDEEKKRYFKIDTHHTARPDAEWAAGNVNKRKAKKVEAQQKRKREEELKWCLKRSRLLADPLTGGRLLREFGVVDPETPVESWTTGLRQRGEVSFLPGQERDPDAPGISCLLVEGGDEAAGVGMVYAGIDRRPLQCAYLSTDKDETINYGITERMRASRLSAIRQEEIRGEISSIAYHQASHKILVASTDFNNAVTTSPMASQGKITLFQPSRTAEITQEGWHRYLLNQYGGRRPAWLLGDTESYVSYTSPVAGLTMHAIRACPTSISGSSGLDALIATSQGIMSIGGSRAGGEVGWVTPKPANFQMPREGRHHHHQNGGGIDVLSVEYHPSSPRVCFAGCRNSKVLRVDTRAPTSSDPGYGTLFRHRSSAAHVRCLDDHRVLVAGPNNAMAIYDTRWLKPRRSDGGEAGGTGNEKGGNGSKGRKSNNNNKGRSGNNTPQPVVDFPAYQNEPHVRIGLDVTHDAGGLGGAGGGGVVAAAQGDGTVGVFSLRTGRRLRAGDVDDPRALRAPGRGDVVKALQFRTLPWEKEASLFAGVGPVVKKFTFGVDAGEDEW